MQPTPRSTNHDGLDDGTGGKTFSPLSGSE